MSDKINACTFIIIVFLIAGCRVSKPVARKPLPEGDAQSYIEKYKDLAIREMMRTGVPASITLAQAMIESDFGRSTLARQANNHFGIKCHNDWMGPTMRYDDDSRNECFRKYRDPEESFQDHSDFLKSGSRYQALFDLDPHDYRGWALGLKKAGYATDPNYAALLIRKIEENDLSSLVIGKTSKGSFLASKGIPRDETISSSENPEMTENSSPDTEKKNTSPVFDKGLAVHAVAGRIMENNRVEYIIVRPGDTVENLEKEFQLLGWELKQYNDITGDMKLVPGQTLYLQPKRSKAEPGKYYHTCTAGETMYTISQKYAIKLKRLYELNRMNPGVPVHPGERLWLRMVRPK